MLFWFKSLLIVSKEGDFFQRAIESAEGEDNAVTQLRLSTENISSETFARVYIYFYTGCFNLVSINVARIPMRIQSCNF